MTETPAAHPRIVVAGAGFGGPALAEALGGAPCEVTLINRIAVMLDCGWAYVTFDRVSRLITGDITPETPMPAKPRKKKA